MKVMARAWLIKWFWLCPHLKLLDVSGKVLKELHLALREEVVMLEQLELLFQGMVFSIGVKGTSHIA